MYLRGEAGQYLSAVRPIPRRPDDAPAPLSHGQEQLWLLSQMLPKATVYNECVTIHLPGALNAAAFEKSFNEILRRHEVWRTSFPVVHGRPIQQIHPPPHVALPVVDLRLLPVADREPAALRLASEEAVQPFDMANGPLLRATLVQLGDSEHRLFLTLHHIIFDGVAMYQVFLPELSAVYDAYCDGRPSPLPEPPIQYADYAYWQRQQQAEVKEHLPYWRQQLGGDLPALALPSDRPRPAAQTFRGSMQPFALSKELTDSLRGLSSREGVTLYTTLLAAYNALLHRYSGQTDILVGTATSGRVHPGTERMLGFFLNTVVMRSDLSGDPTFSELLAREQAVTLGALAHENMPFQVLVKELQPERDLSVNPLFQVLLTLEPPLPVLPNGWSLTQMDVETHAAKFDLSLELDDRPEGLIGRFEYSTDLFDQETIERMIGHWITILRGVAADPSLRLSHIPLLIDDERRQQLVQWNDTALSGLQDLCLPLLFERQVNLAPDTTALLFRDQRLSYRELNSQANKLAHHLRAFGVGPGALVGICIERSPAMMVGLLGILKAGAAYVPLDPAFPEERLVYMLEDAKIKVLVSTRSAADGLPTRGVHMVLLDEEWPTIARQPATTPPVVVGAADLAYVIYTSGSSGKPKGVEIPHGALANFLLSMQVEPGMRSHDVLLAVTTISFDIAALELFLPLISGACVALAPRDVVANGTALLSLLRRTGATVMQATPTTWRLLLAVGWPEEARIRILCGGEAMTQDLARELLPRATSLWNMYGPTETTVWSSVCKVESAENAVSLGHPIANTQLYILDEHRQLVPIGASGELYIGGAGLARGYRNRQDLTGERFVDNPFSDGTDRLYRTGDCVRRRPDGRIEYLGRLDFQVKMRGFRIELGDIEAALSLHPSVRQCVVIALGDSPDRQRLVAYVVPNEYQPSERELRRFLRQKLPDYMIPSACVLLDELPQTPNGKINRRALPLPESSAGESEAADSAVPELTLHHQLIEIWEQLLEARPIGIRDNFFELGGHSLLAVQLIDRIEELCGRRLPLATLFEGATIAEIAESLLAPAEGEQYPQLLEIQPGNPANIPFFFLHGDLEGGGFYCAKLARGLGEDLPFYALQPHGVDGTLPPASVQEMATSFIASLRAVAPHGPYLLGGFCMAGLIAYEMGRQLRNDGEEVQLVAMINTPLPGGRARLAHQALNAVGRVLRLNAARQVDLFLRLRSFDTSAVRFISAKGAELDQTIRRLRRLLPGDTDGIGFGRQLPGPQTVPAKQREELFGRYTWAQTGYIAAPYNGRVALFWPRDEVPAKISDPTMGWRKLVREADTFFVPGHHLTSITHSLPILTAQLRQSIYGAPKEEQ